MTCKIMIILATSFFWAIAALILLMLFFGCHSAAHLKATGVDTAAVIISTEIKTHPRGKSQVCVVSYIFVPKVKTNLSGSYIGQTSFSASSFCTLRTGDTLEVTYDPRSPSYSMLKSELNVRLAHPYAFFFLAVETVLPVLSFLTGAGLLYARRQYLRERRLVQWGSVASGVITGERQVASGRTCYTHVAYQFRDQAGKLVTGERGGLPSKKALKSGSGLTYYAAVVDNPTVLYDPTNSSRNLLYPPGMVKCLPSGM